MSSLALYAGCIKHRIRVLVLVVLLVLLVALMILTPPLPEALLVPLKLLVLPEVVILPLLPMTIQPLVLLLQLLLVLQALLVVLVPPSNAIRTCVKPPVRSHNRVSRSQARSHATLKKWDRCLRIWWSRQLTIKTWVYSKCVCGIWHVFSKQLDFAMFKNH
jgi:hypothetical protein